MVRCGVSLAALLVIGTSPSTHALAQAPVAVQSVAEILAAVGAKDVISKLFDKLTKEKIPEEKAREPLREFYKSLLELRDRRAELYRAILSRLSDSAANKSDSSLLKSEYWPASYREVRKAAHSAGGALRFVELSLSRIQVDLDVQDPRLTASFRRYKRSGQAGLLILGVDPTNLGQMKSLKREMEKNDKLLDETLDRLRSLTQKYYPKIGDLMQ